MLLTHSRGHHPYWCHSHSPPGRPGEVKQIAPRSNQLPQRLTTGEEDLYATLTPSPSLTEKQLHEILYDHLITRHAAEVDYEALSDEAQAALAE
jgi:hypothetical protein